MKLITIDDLRADNERLRRDVSTLLSQIDAHQEATGEDLEIEDRAIVEQIRTELAATPNVAVKGGAL